MTSTTVQRTEDTIEIHTTVDLPKSPTFPISSPVSEPMNTAEAVTDLYAER